MDGIQYEKFSQGIFMPSGLETMQEKDEVLPQK
jgi:hypothetical protein